MPDIKEKPPIGKPKTKRPAMLPPKQAARLLKEKYIKALDQRPEGCDGDSGDAPEQVEKAGRWAVDELTNPPRRPDRRRVKEEPRAAAEPSPAGPETAPATDTPTPERPANAPKECQTVGYKAAAEGNQADTGQHITPKERPTARKPKERPAPNSAQPPPHITPPASDLATAPARSAQPRQAQRRFVLNNRRRGLSALHQPTDSTGPRSALNPSVSGAPQGLGAVKERTQAAKSTIKTRPATRGAAKSGRVTPKPRPSAPPPSVRMGGRKVRQQAQQQISRVMNTQAAKAAKTAAVAVKRVTVAVGKAAAALVSAVVGIAGAGILLVAIIIVVVIAAVASSPFGLFFAAEPNAPDAVSVAEAVSSVNMTYNARLEKLQTGSYDSIVIEGQAADWPEVLAVFAVKLAGADAGGMDVATLDADRVERLTAVFWDMTAITTWVEEIHHPGSGGDDPGWTEYILHIVITPKTADDMRTVYNFIPLPKQRLERAACRPRYAGTAGNISSEVAVCLRSIRALQVYMPQSALFPNYL